MLISKTYKYQILKKIGTQLKNARQLSKLELSRVSKLSLHTGKFLQGLEEGDPGDYQKFRVEDLVMLMTIYGKELVVSWQDLPLEERYGNLRYYSEAELKNFLNTDQTITY